jgi:hypothetical protein
MLRIFADYKQSALALDNLTLRTALANGGTYFHDYTLLTSVVQPKVELYLYYSIPSSFDIAFAVWLWDSQDERVAFGDGHGMFIMCRQ